MFLNSQYCTVRRENVSEVSKLKRLFLLRVSASALPSGGGVLNRLRIMIVRLIRGSSNRKSAAPSENNERWKDVVMELEREIRQVTVR